MMFESKFHNVGKVNLPDFTGSRIMMMPVILGNPRSIPTFLKNYGPCLDNLFKMTDPKHLNQVGYITIDERMVKGGKTHRRAGLHVDGVYDGKCGSWGGGGGGWGPPGNGMLTVSSVPGCKAYGGSFSGKIGKDGECDDFINQCSKSRSQIFESNSVYWVDGLCIHESIPMEVDTNRQFVRLSMPSSAPWFKGYTENPLGILPSGPILERRKYMDI